MLAKLKYKKNPTAPTNIAAGIDATATAPIPAIPNAPVIIAPMTL